MGKISYEPTVFKSNLEKLIYLGVGDTRMYPVGDEDAHEMAKVILKRVQEGLKQDVSEIMLNGYDNKYDDLMALLSDGFERL